MKSNMMKGRPGYMFLFINKDQKFKSQSNLPRVALVLSG